MYHRYFGLQEEPFSIAVNPHYLFMSARHRDALAHLLYGVGEGGGFILLTGEVGTGKTTINRCLLEQLPDNTDIALILNPALNAIELLATVCDELSIAYQPGEQSLKILTDKLHQFLLSNYANGRNTVLLIDEAQHLDFEVLEQIRLLTNLETNTKKLLQIILVGQPELRALLNKPELRQLAQRITARYQLKPLNLQETDAYIRHRLQVAGLPANQQLFPAGVVKKIHRVSRGVPRIINVLCARMLLGCYGQNKTVVDRAMLKQAIVEVMGEDEEELQAPRSNTPLYVTLGVCFLLVIGLWQWPVLGELLQARPAATQATAQPLATAAVTTPVAITPPVTTPLDATQPLAKAPSESLEPAATRQPWLASRYIALQQLAIALGTDRIDCQPGSRYRCETLTVSSWQELQAYNRPAVLTLISPAKFKRYAALIALDPKQATLLIDGQQQLVDIDQLGQLWTGEFTFLWRPAADYSGPISLGASGPMVSWLAEQFARLDNQATPLASTTFSEPLQQRIKIFQRQHQLQDDGVVGLKTLLALNARLGIDATLIPASPEGV
jgi:general secretion pathway protein A